MVHAKRTSKILVVILVVILAAGAFVIARHKNRQTIQVTASSGSAKKTAPPSRSENKQATNNGFTAPSDNKAPAPSTTLVAPSGTFVSNHQPSLSGSSTPSSEQSVCNTSAGASCYIEFTKDSVIKQLPAETADSGGAVYWTWDVNQAGLTTGKWQITAVSSLNGQTKTAQDSLELNVRP